MGFGELIGKFFQWLYEFWPVRVIRVYQRGVRFWMGIPREEQLLPGIHAYLPFVGAIEIIDVVEDVIDLPTQSITTADGKTISFSANISYEVTDAVSLYTKVQDFGENLSRVACGHLAVRVREQSWAQLQDEQRKLELSLRDTLTTRVKGWGVRIIECRLTDCVPAKQIRLVP